jgi:hypothetical protein
MNVVYQRIAVRINDLENHRTETEHEVNGEAQAHPRET